VILCLNLNAAIDKTAVVSPFHLNTIHRSEQIVALPGGKGCNVARALKRLGEEATVSGWVGGFAGQFIESGLQAEGIATNFVHTEAESRTCLSILDPEADTLTELYEKGAPIPVDKLDELIALFQSIIGGFQLVALSGSLPAGVPPDFYARLTQIAHAANISVLLDTSGEALQLGLQAKPLLIKPNRTEFTQLLGRELKDTGDYAAAARDIAAQYDMIVVLSLGADGAIAAQGQSVVQAQPPPLTIVSAVGSGDCLLAGVAYGLTHSFTLGESLQYGVAAGTANALRLGAGIFTLEDFNRIHKLVTIKDFS
jgi:tagatose 6-phosphate kinase